jgi:hypothetical protein
LVDIIRQATANTGSKSRLAGKALLRRLPSGKRINKRWCKSRKLARKVIELIQLIRTTSHHPAVANGTSIIGPGRDELTDCRLLRSPLHLGCSKLYCRTKVRSKLVEKSRSSFGAQPTAADTIFDPHWRLYSVLRTA